MTLILLQYEMRKMMSFTDEKTESQRHVNSSVVKQLVSVRVRAQTPDLFGTRDHAPNPCASLCTIEQRL